MLFHCTLFIIDSKWLTAPALCCWWRCRS